MILVVSYPGEEHTEAVVNRLQQCGRSVVQIDLAEFPTKRGVSFSWADGVEPRFLIEHSGGTIDLQNAHVAWWRRVQSYHVDQRISNFELRTFALSETSQAVDGAFDSLHCRWINDRACDAAAHHKPYQWSEATKLGLRVPRTLVTTQPDLAREFISSNAKTVFKPFLACIQEWRETRLIEPADLDQLHLVQYAPVIFQEYIDGVDLRITIVGDQIFAAEIDARKTSYPVDMRMVVGEATVKPIELPAKLQTHLLQLQQVLGLSYGAIDMRRTSDDEYYFLEVNPAGQWLFVEQRTELPISQAVADLLVSHDHVAASPRFLRAVPV